MTTTPAQAIADIDRHLTAASHAVRQALEEAQRELAAAHLALIARALGAGFRRDTLTIEGAPGFMVHRIEAPFPAAAASQGNVVIEVFTPDPLTVSVFWAKDSRLAALRYRVATNQDPPWLDVVRKLAGEDW